MERENVEKYLKENLVVWFDSGFEGKQLRSTSYAGLKSWAKDIEILGNIYENPELLENNG
jgi:yopX protein